MGTNQVGVSKALGHGVSVYARVARCPDFSTLLYPSLHSSERGHYCQGPAASTPIGTSTVKRLLGAIEHTVHTSHN